MLDTILAAIEHANPAWYFALLICAGLGLPVSEDMLAVWAGALIGRGQAPYATHWYVLALYFGVVGSDMLTFYLGRLARRAMGGWLFRTVFRNPQKADEALDKISRHGDFIGFVMRFSVGARLPLTFVSGFSGVSGLRFALGTATGALFTLPAQLGAGYLMRDQIDLALDFISRYGFIIALIIVGLFTSLIIGKLKRPQQQPEHRPQRPGDTQ